LGPTNITTLHPLAGVFMLFFARAIARGEQFCFTQRDIKFLRVILAAELALGPGKLLF
jgi:hypothetical protein